MRRTPLTSALAALALTAFAGSAPATTPPAGVVSEAPATQMATVQYVFHSAKVGRDFLIKVTSPFHPMKPGETRPVIYALDGGYEIAGPIAWLLGGAGGMPEAFVVSVGSLPGDYRFRAHDLAFRSYVDDYDKVTVESGAPAFRAFLNEELRPFIDHRLPVDESRAILFGHSEGALFAANILADRPREYAGYIIASPSVWSDPSILERLRANLPKAAGAKVFLAVGGGETADMLKAEGDIDGLLKATAGVTYHSQVYPGGTHLSYYPAMITEAFPWMLAQ